MKIAFMDFFGPANGKNAEEEITKRLRYCFEKQGDDFFVIDEDQKVTSGPDFIGKNIDNTDIDLFFTFNHCEYLPILPNKKGVFFHWAPSGFLPANLVKQYISNMYCFDDVVGGYETSSAKYDCLNAGYTNPLLTHIGSSVPKDYVISPKEFSSKKLFYVGINLENDYSTPRFKELFRLLDNQDLIDFYGPEEVYGIKDCWKGYRSYKGSIPFDGKSIMQKINDTGIVLALNSPVHNNVGSVSNRIYEAAAGGALIISDETPYVRKYFGDSVFYLDLEKSEEELSQEVEEIIKWANENPRKAYEKAVASQKCFLQHLTLDKMIESFKKEIKIKNIPEEDIIDVVCFIETKEDYYRLLNLCKEQHYKKLNIIMACKTCNYKKYFKDDKVDNITFIHNKTSSHGKLFVDIKKHLKGEYFTILDKYSHIQSRHLLKLISKLKKSEELCVYSGSYTKFKSEKNYAVVNYKRIFRDEFLAFIYKDIAGALNIEKRVQSACCLFKKDILDISSSFEIEQMSKSLHYYFIASYILKNNKMPIFIPIITSGYLIEKNSELSQIYSNDFFDKYNRTEDTTFKELLGVLLSYDISSDIYQQNEDRIKTTIVKENNIAGISRKTKHILKLFRNKPFVYNLLKKRYKRLPSLSSSLEMNTFLRRKKITRIILYLLSKLVKEKNENKNETLPKVTIITVTYNLIDAGRKEFFKKCIESLSEQTYQNIEHIIIDGASTDGTLEFFNELNFVKPIQIYSQPDTGMWNAMNKGIKKATGEYICFLNSDDYYVSNTIIEESVNAIKNNDADYSVANMMAINLDGSIIADDIKVFPKEYFYRHMTYNHETLVCKKSIYKKLNYHNEKYKTAIDYSFNIMLVLNGYKQTYVDKVMIAARVGGATVNKDSTPSNKTLNNVINVWSDFFSFHKVTKEDCSKILARESFPVLWLISIKDYIKKLRLKNFNYNVFYEDIDHWIAISNKQTISKIEFVKYKILRKIVWGKKTL